jgi:hypothetical protein
MKKVFKSIGTIMLSFIVCCVFMSIGVLGCGLLSNSYNWCLDWTNIAFQNPYILTVLELIVMSVHIPLFVVAALIAIMGLFVFVSNFTDDLNNV